MARGWESKAVEAQMEEAAAERRRGRTPPEAGNGGLSRERRSLLLAKTRIVNEMHTTANDRLQRPAGRTSLAAIDKQLSALK